ncbi:MAG: sigma-70 family RNA polymerase sigma factor [Verrucomicrobia bacterium]|nr:sigma-70 family RNA polymerase sigma factor [Verrucomicrobiota bacterium]
MSTRPSDEEDAADMASLAAGRDAALDGLMARHGERLFHYLIRLLQNEDDASDLAQETFVRVYQHRTRFNPQARFSTWLYTIATNLVRSEYRWRKRRPHVSLEAENPETGHDFRETIADGRASPSESILADERAELVRSAVRSLPDDLRVPLILFEYERKSQSEIAAILDCSAKAVEMRLYRARQQLKNKLSKLLQASE